MKKFIGMTQYLMPVNQRSALTQIDKVQLAVYTAAPRTAYAWNEILPRIHGDGITGHAFHSADNITRTSENHQISLFELNMRQLVHHDTVSASQRLVYVRWHRVHGESVEAHNKQDGQGDSKHKYGF